MARDSTWRFLSEALIRGADSGLDQRSYWWLDIAGRLHAGATLAEAEIALQSMQASIREATLPDWPAENVARYLDDPFTLTSAGSGVSRLRDRYGESVLVLMGVSALVLIVACANIANLFLARATSRRRDLAIRISVGASRLRVTQQLVVESLVVGLSGAAAGILLAQGRAGFWCINSRPARGRCFWTPLPMRAFSASPPRSASSPGWSSDWFLR